MKGPILKVILNIALITVFLFILSFFLNDPCICWIWE